MVNGKAKGNNFEREICKQLSNWVTNGQKSDVFWRSINSGAMVTNSFKKQQKQFENHVGDITAILDEGNWLIQHFAVEVKHYKDLQAENLVFGTKGKLHDFWKTHSQLCEKAMKVPLLIARQNYRPDLLLMPTNVFTLLTYIQNEQLGQVSVAKENLTTSHFEKFLELISYDRFRTVIDRSLLKT